MRKVALLIFVITFSACSSVEIMEPDAVTTNRANHSYAKSDFGQAAEVYRRLIEKNPDSRYRKMAYIGIADAFYKDKSYIEAQIYYDQFIEQFPLDRLTNRALFYNGMCYYLDVTTSDRDQASAKKGIELFKKYERQYPGLPLAPFAKTYRVKLESIVTESEIGIVRFYYKVDKSMSAIRRLQDFILEYPDSEFMPEALFMLGDSFLREQSYRKSAVAFDQLIRKYPDSHFARMAISKAERIKIKK